MSRSLSLFSRPFSSLLRPFSFPVRFFSSDDGKNMRLDPQQSKLMDNETREVMKGRGLWRNSVRSFFERFSSQHQIWEKEGIVPKSIWKEAGEAGILCTTVKEQFGGPSASIIDAAVVWEEQSYSGCSGPAFMVHSDIVAPYISNYGTEEQKERYLPGMVRGDLIGAIAMTEPSAGSDLQSLRTVALQKEEGGDFILNGSKIYITHGGMADIVIVAAKTNPSAKGAHSISLFLVERGMEGFVSGKPLAKMGLRSQDTTELFFDDVRVPQENLLGTLHEGFGMMMSELPQERLLIADCAVSSAEACFELTRTWLKERQAFGGPLIKQQALRHRMARMKTDLAVGRTFVDHCLSLHAENKLDSQTASMAKVWGTEMQGRVLDEGVQMHGGYGYMMDSPVARMFVDGRVQRIYGGSNEIMLELISRSL